MELKDGKLSALGLNYGLSAAEIADIIQKYGEQALQLIVDGIRYGLTKEFLVRVLKFFGPLLLEFIVSSAQMRFLASPKALQSSITTEETGTKLGDTWRLAPVIIEGEEVDAFDAESSFWQVLIDKFLPILIEKYRDQIIQLLLDLIKQWVIIKK